MSELNKTSEMVSNEKNKKFLLVFWTRLQFIFALYVVLFIVGLVMNYFELFGLVPILMIIAASFGFFHLLLILAPKGTDFYQ